MTRKVLAFAGQTYYAGGGFADFVGLYNSVEEAIEATPLVIWGTPRDMEVIPNSKPSEDMDDDGPFNDWRQIVDYETFEILAEHGAR